LISFEDFNVLSVDFLKEGVSFLTWQYNYVSGSEAEAGPCSPRIMRLIFFLVSDFPTLVSWWSLELK
jgi:hypothetical protein